MWPAPTAEDWKRPCLITWQRSFEDAVAVSKETEKPILICVNMDGEIASEHYAGIRYRQPDIAALYEPYVCVIASVYRHNPRDYDEEGRRILCPRFGSVTCGEHIWIEPGLFEQYFEGQRVAPRHIGVELDSMEMYDVYYAFDTDTIFNSLREGIENREIQPKPIVRGDRTITERVDSPDIADRIAVESAYIEGDPAARRELLQAIMASRRVVHIDVLRLAIFGFDVEMGRLARQILAQANTPQAIDLINEALRVPMEGAERDALIAALERIGKTTPRARTLAAVHRGLASSSQSVDVDAWVRPASHETLEKQGRSTLESRLEYSSAATQARPEDPTAQLEFAEASLALAVDPETAQALAADPRTYERYARLMFEDVRRAALEAESNGARGWRLDATVGLAAYYLGDDEVAFARAEAAVDAMPKGEQSWNSMAVLGVFAESRRQSIAKAVREKAEWPAEWLTDVHAAYQVLARHPHGNDQQVVAHYDFLRRMGAFGRAAQVLEEGLARFPDSWELHDRMRTRILAEKGVDELEAAYEAMLRADDVSPHTEWFAGYASIVAAEFYRRSNRDTEAVAAYERAIVHYENTIASQLENRESADHYVALAIAGRARVALKNGDYARAHADVLASFERKTDAADDLDGLGFSPVGTAQMLLAKLKEGEHTELATSLEAALDSLDPILLRLPEFERQGPRRAERNRRRRDGDQ